MYEIEKASGGGLRPTTLRDAKKLGLYPSVTSIMKMMPAPALETWKAKQAVIASRSMRKRRDESEEQFAMRAIAEAAKPVAEAAEIGSRIHGALETFFLGRYVPIEYLPFIEGVREDMYNSYSLPYHPQDWTPEKSFSRYGFGGKVDLHNAQCVLDFKTKDFDEDHLPQVYDNHAIQLAAYRRGLELGDVPGYIVFVSHSTPGLAHTVRLSPEALDRGWEIFIRLFEVWKVLKGYNPNA